MKLPQIAIKIIGILSLAVLSLPSIAAPVDMYQGQVAVASHSPEDWNKSLAPALVQVLQKISGDPKVADNPAIKPSLNRAGDYVQSFNYITGTNPPLALQIRFSPKAIDSILQNSNSVAATAVASPSATATNQVDLTVAGIKDLNDYAALMNYLHSLSSVASLDVRQTAGDKIVISVGARGDSAALVKEISQGSQMAALNTPGSTDALSYRWQGINTMPSATTSNAVTAQDVSNNVQSYAAPDVTRPVADTNNTVPVEVSP